MSQRNDLKAMNLDTIAIAPHAEGFIKVACETDPLFSDRPRTRNEFLITARHHAVSNAGSEEPGQLAPAAGHRAPPLALHPLHEKIAQADSEGERKVVKEIPIRLFFNKPDKAISIAYQAFSNDALHVPVCSGNGKDATRLIQAADNTNTTSTVACSGPERCDFVRDGKAVCRRQVRMAVQIKDQPNPLTVFEVRTSSLNSYRALRSQLHVIDKLFGGLRHVPLKLTLWQSSNEASGYEPFDLIQLALDAPDEKAAMQVVATRKKENSDAGLGDDDFDSLSAAGVEDELGAPTLDYQAMSEMYEPARRRGARLDVQNPARGAPAGAASAVVSAALEASGHAPSAQRAAAASQVPVPVFDDVGH